MRGAPIARTLQPRPATASMETLCGSACVAIGVLSLLVALFRHALGASVRAQFWPVFLSLPIVCARLAHQNSTAIALWLAAGVLVAGGALHYGAKFMNRRAPDAVLWALLAFQIFFLARYGGALLPPAAPLSFTALSLPQKINMVLQLALLAVGVAWSTRPLITAGYESSAPSRVTGFLKKRRMPSRIAGVFIMVIAIIATHFSARAGFENPHALSVFAPPLLFVMWIALDGFYVLGRALWQRVH